MIPNSLSVVLPDAEVHEPVVVRPRKTFLLSPFFDFFMSGGGSLAVFAICMLFFDRSSAPSQYVGLYPNGHWLPNPTLAAMGQTTFYLAFLVNSPHFLVSYQLLYWDNRKRILNHVRFAAVAIAIPGALLGSMIYAAVARPDFLHRFVTLMFLLVGWHYAKQVYGIMLFISARASVYYSNLEKAILRGALLSLTLVGWISSNLPSAPINLYGFSAPRFSMPTWAMDSTQTVFAILAVVFFGLMIRKYLVSGQFPPFTSLLAFSSLAVWYLPLFGHALFFYTIPFFHSLQYLWFVIAFRRNKVASDLENKEGLEYRRGNLLFFWGYLALAIFLGTMAFDIVPNNLDQLFPFEFDGEKQSLFIMLFVVFFNVHHFFIDSVIWRKENPDAQKFLLK